MGEDFRNQNEPERSEQTAPRLRITVLHVQNQVGWLFV